MSRLNDYQKVAPKGTIDFLKRLAEQVKGRKILHINATKLGGGVAEMLRSDVLLLQDIGYGITLGPFDYLDCYSPHFAAVITMNGIRIQS